jgi:hypothetical protein
VNDEEHIVAPRLCSGRPCARRRVCKFEDDAFADAPHAADDLAVNRFDRRIDGAKYEGAEEVNPLEALSDDVARQRFEIDEDVGELGQPFSLFSTTRRSARASSDDRRSGAG